MSRIHPCIALFLSIHPGIIACGDCECILVFVVVVRPFIRIDMFSCAFLCTRHRSVRAASSHSLPGVSPDSLFAPRTRTQKGNPGFGKRGVPEQESTFLVSQHLDSPLRSFIPEHRLRRVRIGHRKGSDDRMEGQTSRHVRTGTLSCCVLCCVVSLSSPQFLFPLYRAGRRLDGVPETREIRECRRGLHIMVDDLGMRLWSHIQSQGRAALLSRTRLQRFPATNFRTFWFLFYTLRHDGEP